MKNAIVFVDVDLTLVDANCKLLDGAQEGLQLLKDKGCHLFLWSTCGAEYCRKGKCERRRVHSRGSGRRAGRG